MYKKVELTEDDGTGEANLRHGELEQGANWMELNRQFLY